jgi:uncharacterized protein DUF6058
VTLDRVRDRYLAVNGDHPMTPADDAYVVEHFVEVPDGADLPREQAYDLMAEGRLPLPSYLLSDGTPMVHPDYLRLMRSAGSVEGLHDWFVGHWPDEEGDVAEEEWAAYLSGQYVCLWSVTPQTIMAKTDAIEAIKARIAELEAGDGSRDRLLEAVGRLDALEPPFTAYDGLRFGGPSSRQVWIEDVTAAHLAE